MAIRGSICFLGTFVWGEENTGDYEEEHETTRQCDTKLLNYFKIKVHTTILNTNTNIRSLGSEINDGLH